jgi:hypothetical protein
MTTETFPSIAPDRMRFGMVSNTQEHTSPLSGSTQTIELPSPRWVAELTYQRRPPEQAALLQAFLAKLRGRAGRFYMPNFQRAIPRGTIAGTLQVNGAAQTGSSLILDGATPATSFAIGDYFSVNYELKIVTAVATSDGAGNITVSFSPPLRASPADNAAVTLSSPTAIFRLEEDKSYWDDEAGLSSDFTISCIEAF